MFMCTSKSSIVADLQQVAGGGIFANTPCDSDVDSWVHTLKTHI